MTALALQDRVFIRQDEKQTRTPAGIIIPEKAQKSSKEGVVVSVGPGTHSANGQLIPTSLKVGDRVLFNPNVGFVVDIDGEKLFVTLEKEVFGIFE